MFFFGWLSECWFAAFAKRVELPGPGEGHSRGGGGATGGLAGGGGGLTKLLGVDLWILLLELWRKRKRRRRGRKYSETS